MLKTFPYVVASFETPIISCPSTLRTSYLHMVGIYSHGPLVSRQSNVRANKNVLTFEKLVFGSSLTAIVWLTKGLSKRKEHCLQFQLYSLLLFLLLSSQC